MNRRAEAALRAWRAYWDRDEGGTDEEGMTLALRAASEATRIPGSIPVPFSAEMAEDSDDLKRADALIASVLSAEGAQRRDAESNIVSSIVFDQFTTFASDAYPDVALRYGIADALWDAGFRKHEVGE